METNETVFPEQNESKNMETNNEEEMSLQDKPTPKPRARGAKDDAILRVHKLHEKREAKWMQEKENLLVKIDYLEKQNDEHEQTLKINCETLEKKCEDLKKTCVDWEKKCEQLEECNASLLSQREQACKIINELQERSTEMVAQNQSYFQDGQALQNEAHNLRKHLDEKDELYKQALEQNQVYENQLSDNEQEIQGLKEELAKHEKKLTKQKEQYAEFSSITNDMERELHENQSKVRELNRILQTKTKENRQMLEEKNEAIRKFERTNETLSSQTAMLTNHKDKLESELVTMKLEHKKLITENEKMQGMKQKLAEERDWYVEKCRKLEEGVKINAETEISHLTEAVEGLNHENEVLRERNEKLQRDVSALRSINNDLQAKNTQSNGSLGEDNSAFKSEEPFRQKKPESMDTTNGINTPEVRRTIRSSDRSGPRGAPRPASTPTAKSTNRSNDTPNGTAGQQWYETGEGGEIFSQIYSELNQKFATIDISREVSTKDISLLVTTDQRQKFEVHFPRNFPLAAVKVSYADTLKEVMVPYNKNAGSSDFCANFSRMLAELMYEVNTQK